MIHLALVCCGLFVALADDPSPPSSSPPDLKAYEAAKASAGSSAEAQVKLALWCEARGLSAERLKHLARAVLIDPKNATARGLLGLVVYGGNWIKPEEVSAQIQADEALSAKRAEYNARSAALEDRLKGRNQGHRLSRSEASKAHVALGMWCEQNGLKAEATAHFTSAVVLDPYHEATWKHLGYIKHNGRWMSHDQIAADQREAEAQRHADRQWDPLLRKWRGWRVEKARNNEAEDLLAKVDDPRAVPSIVRIFRDGNESDQRLAVQLFGQIDSPASTGQLAALAVFSPSGTVRGAATEILRNRSPREFAGMLVEMIQAPMTYRVEPVRGPGSPGRMVVETPRFRMLRTYDAPTVAKLGGDRTGFVGYDANGLPAVARGTELRHMAKESPQAQANDIARFEARGMEMLAEAQLKAVSSQQRLIADVVDIEMFNSQAAALNERIIPVLQNTVQAPDLKDDENAWHVWWYDQIGYRYEPPFQTQVFVNASPQLAPPVIVSCFVAGTPVHTLDGHRPIETLRVGDQVLSQDTTTGELSFQSIKVVHHNAPGKTIRVALDNGETLVASVYHRFWRAGRGWAMARELKEGDVLRTLAGLSKIVSVSAGGPEPLFNLDVAMNRTYFVGRNDALVHDNRLPDPRIRPFDAEPVLETSGR